MNARRIKIVHTPRSLKMSKYFVLLFIGVLFSCAYVLKAQTGFSFGGDSTDAIQDFCIDPDGNIIMVGTFSKTVDFNAGAPVHNRTSNGLLDNFIVKYTGDGTFLWAVSFGGTQEDFANGVTTDQNGNIYVCGFFSSQCDFNAGTGSDVRSPKGMTDVYIVKYNPNGSYLWAKTFGGDSNDTAYDIVNDGNNSIHVIGSFEDTLQIEEDNPDTKLISNGKKDVFLVKFTDTGEYVSVYAWGDKDDDEGLAVTANKNGIIYIGGYCTRSIIEPATSISGLMAPKSDADIFLSARTTEGIQLWNNRFGGKGHDQIVRGGIALDSYGDIYLTGWFSDTVDFDPSPGIVNRVSNGGYDVFVAKYSSARTYVSSMSFGSSGNEFVHNLAVDWQGNVFLTGSFTGTVDFDPSGGVRNLTTHGTNGAYDIFTAMYSPTGILFWAFNYGAVISGGDKISSGYSIATDSLNNVYVAGKFYGECDFDPTAGILNFSSSGYSDCFFIKYNHNGLLWMNKPEININSRTAEFGNVGINTQSVLIREIYNQGDGILYISSMFSTNTRFRILETTNYILPGKSFQLAIEFAPIWLGVQTGYIIIEHNGESRYDSILVTGNGYGRMASVTMNLIAGWNMISIPAQVENYSKNALFPQAISEAFEFYDGTYRTRDTFQMVNGYWLKFENPQSVLIEGAARDSATIHVRQGWNLIGTLSSTVYIDSIVQQPPGIIGSEFFGYDGNYYEVKTLVPGKSYWVKMNSSGSLFLKGSELIDRKH